LLRGVGLAAVALLFGPALGCGKSGDKDGDKSGGSKKAAKLNNPNTMSLKSLGRGDKVLIDGEVKMGTVVVTPADQQGNPGLWMWKKGGGCSLFEKKMVHKADKSVVTPRVAIIFRVEDEKAKAGKAPLPKKIKPKSSVIYHKGFNRVLMSFSKDLGHVTILEGKLEPGSQVKGRVKLQDNHGRIQGDFVAKVCPRR